MEIVYYESDKNGEIIIFENGTIYQYVYTKDYLLIYENYILIERHPRIDKEGLTTYIRSKEE